MPAPARGGPLVFRLSPELQDGASVLDVPEVQELRWEVEAAADFDAPSSSLDVDAVADLGGIWSLCARCSKTCSKKLSLF